MSDLLTRMIARSARVTAGIMPVVPSRYEGPAASPAVPDALEEQAREVPVHRREEVRREEVRQGEVRKFRPILRAEAKAIVPPQILDLPQEDGGSMEASKAHSAHFDAIAPGPRATSRLPVRTGSVPEVQSRRSAQDRIDEAAADAAEPEFIPQELPHFDAEAGIIEEPFSHSVPARAEPIHGAPRRRDESENRSGVPERAVEVHVSIGHIELRQTAPAPQPVQRRAPATLPIPLEDLLGRRRGGAR